MRSKVDALRLRGLLSTDMSLEDTRIDRNGHTRIVKLERDGDYNTIHNRRLEKIAKANRDHCRWRKQFLRQARAH